MNIDAVFSGGGVKAFAFVGALQSIEEKGLHLERVAGTSAGAIIASLIAAKYTTEEINNIIKEMNLKKLLDPPKLSTIFPFSKWLFLYYQMGFNRGEKLENWLHKILAAKNVTTFHDIKENYLKLVVSDLSLGKLIVIPDDLEENYGINPKHFPISKAVRMSAGFPFFFMPKKLPGKMKKKSIIVDGGLLSNFPIWVFEDEQGASKRPILGVKLSGAYDRQKMTEINNAIDMLQALISTMKQAHDERYISKKNIKNIIFIPVENVQTVDFNIDHKVKLELINKGRMSANTFLKHWPN